MLALVLLALAACGSSGDPLDAALADATRLDAPAPGDATVEPDGGDPTLTTASHRRQIRGAWVPSAWNISFPSRTGLTEAQARAELSAIVDALAEARMNAMFLQIRPESDALYASSIEPWSRFLTGAQGADPGYDPLSIAIELAHARGIEVHAWLNPYRGMTSTTATTASDHVTRTLSAHAQTYGTQTWMDPGASAVREHVVAVVRDVVSRYDVDGIHFDDYFYPYPVEGETFDDAATYAAYTASGGTLARDDWRRQNVHALVEEVAAAIAEERDDVRFGISPFGIHRPGMPEGITGLDAYAAIYCDPLPWLENAWVDYLAPQLYWPTTQRAQAFVPLLAWWGGEASAERPILAGMNVVRLGDTDAWTLDELRAQYAAVEDHHDANVRGSIGYHVDPILENRLGLRDALRDEIFARPALPPVLPRAIGATPPAPPSVTLVDRTITIASEGAARWAAVYDADATTLLHVVPLATTRTLALAAGEHLVTVVDRRGLESLARRVVVP